MPIAWWKVGVLACAVQPMACLVANKTEFKLLPPNVTLVSPAAVSRLPTVADACELEGAFRSFTADVRDSLVDDPLEARVLVNGMLVSNPDVAPTGEIKRPFRFCLREADFSATCNRIELFVSHELRRHNRDEPTQPVIDGDIDVAVWFVGKESDPPDPNVDVFDACLAMTREDPEAAGFPIDAPLMAPSGEDGGS